MAEDFRDLRKLQLGQFDAWEKRQDVIDRVLLRNFKASYLATVQQIATLYAKVGLDDPVNGIYIRKEDAIHYNQLYNRLANIEKELRALEKAGVKLTEENSAQSFQDGYYRNVWAYNQAVGVPLGIPALPIEAIKSAVYPSLRIGPDKKVGLSLVTTWNKNTTDQIYKTQSAIIRGITLGQSYTKVARSIKAEFDKGLWQAMRVVRTEAGRNWSEGAEASHNAAIEAGLDVKKRWSASLDSRTRLSHANLDVTFADNEGLFYLGGEGQPQPRLFSDPAESINCRCSVYDVIDDITPTVRRIRGQGIVPYQTFAEWGADKGWDPVKGWGKVKL